MKEVGVVREVEFKFRHPGTTSDFEIAAWISSLVSRDHSVEVATPRSLIDIYLDTPNLALFSAGASFRLRRLNRPGSERRGFSVNYKPPGEELEGSLVRTEYRTRVLDNELGDYPDSTIPGAAAAAAYEDLRRAGNPPDSVQAYPVIRCLTNRRTFYFVDSHSREGRFLLFLHFDTSYFERLDPLKAHAALSFQWTPLGQAHRRSEPIDLAELEVPPRRRFRSPNSEDEYERVVRVLIDKVESISVTKYWEGISSLYS